MCLYGTPYPLGPVRRRRNVGAFLLIVISQMRNSLLRVKHLQDAPMTVRQLACLGKGVVEVLSNRSSQLDAFTLPYTQLA